MSSAVEETIPEQAGLAFTSHNPDVLTCIANLSNDEVFTPPAFANRMLDTLAEGWADANDGADIWADSTVKFLDPFTKSGVFLREITRRLTEGLAGEIPNLAQRVDHILTKQVYGIGITSLTALLARRSLYCSKFANGKHSIASSFATEEGNVWFERTEHAWERGKCRYCGASEAAFSRDVALETHAYAFIHTDKIKARMAELFGADMQFDVIVGNPPYQLEDGGFGSSAAPIYNRFVEQAKKLEPRFLTMVVPARWFAGGKGLDEFREAMLKDSRLRILEDFPDSSEVFPGVVVRSGVCYFLWDRDTPGLCAVTTNDKGRGTTVHRPLLEKGASVFVRYNEALPILKKVVATENTEVTDSLALPTAHQFSDLISSRKPFGFDTSVKGCATQSSGDVKIYQNGGSGFIPRNEIAIGEDAIDKWKVFTSYAYGGSNTNSFHHQVIGKPFIGEPGSVSSETYLYLGPFESEEEARNAASYLCTRMARFLVLLHKSSHHVTRKVYTFVPKQDFSRPWTDDDLREKYGITDEEWAFVEKMVRPMELDA